MLLTIAEKEFLAAFIHEATTDPFKGPVTAALHQRDIYYSDLGHLMAAYYRESNDAQGGFGGVHNPSPPACPWCDRDTATRRDREVEAEMERMNKISA